MFRQLVVVLTLLFVSAAMCEQAWSYNSLKRVNEPMASACEPGCVNCRIMRACPIDQAQFTNCVGDEVCDTNVCKPGVLASNCSCEFLPDGIFPDAYSTRCYFECKTSVADFTCCKNTNEYYSPSIKGCSIVPECVKAGSFSDEGDCQRYYTCTTDGTGFSQEVFLCNFNEVYDETVSKCHSLTPSCTSSGPIADPYKCDLYHICASVGDTNPRNLCCPTDQIYSMDSFSCVPTDGSCKAVGLCYDSYYEIGTCKRCTSASDRFPSGKCSKYYYTCEDGSNVEILNECPGDLIYNPSPTAQWCDLRSNVPGCSPI